MIFVVKPLDYYQEMYVNIRISDEMLGTLKHITLTELEKEIPREVEVVDAYKTPIVVVRENGHVRQIKSPDQVLQSIRKL